MDGVIKISREGSAAHHASSMDHRRLQKSSTLNRKFVKKPTAKQQPKIEAPKIAKRSSGSVPVVNSSRRLLSKQHSVQLRPVSSSRKISISEPKATQKIAIKEAAGVQRVQQKAQPQQVAKTTQVQTQTQRVAAKVAQAPAKKSDTALAASRLVAQRKSGQQASKEVVQQPEVAKVARARMSARRAPAPEMMSAQELKDRAIQQALKRMSTVKEEADFDEVQPQKRHFWQKKSFAISAAMAMVVIALVGYLVYANLPDLSVRVAAMQSGISKAYPSFVPSNYRLDGLVKEENGRITMAFKNDNGKKFMLYEEKSGWDSAAVLSNYVQKEWDDYTVTKGQGLTIYMSGSNAVWVNGGVFYSISDDSGTLTSNDLHDIAVSL